MDILRGMSSACRLPVVCSGLYVLTNSLDKKAQNSNNGALRCSRDLHFAYTSPLKEET